MCFPLSSMETLEASKWVIVMSICFPYDTSCCSVMSDSLWPHMSGFLAFHSLPKFALTHVHWVSDAIQPVSSSDSLSSFCPQSSLAFRDFSTKLSACVRWPKYCSFSFSPSSEYSGLSSLKIDWFDLLAVQRTFRNRFQHHSSKVSLLWRSAFFTVQLSQLCDHWEDRSLDYTDLCQQSSVSAFQHAV